jgi:uncharacterized protein (TIGR03083 family)
MGKGLRKLMQINDYIGALEREGHLMFDAAQSARVDARVPCCPGWTLHDVLAHIGFVHRWAAKYVREGLTEVVDEPDEPAILAAAPVGDGVLPWAAEGHAALVRALRAAPADLRCWTFLGAPSPLAFWARRQAHETAVHRVDAELATGSEPSPVEKHFAADGVDELLVGFVPRRGSRAKTKVTPGTITFSAPDADASWRVVASDAGVETQRGAGQADLSVRAPAEDLYLVLWNRRPPDRVELDGRADLLGDWQRLLQVRW